MDCGDDFPLHLHLPASLPSVFCRWEGMEVVVKKGRGGQVCRGKVKRCGRRPPGRCAPRRPAGELPPCAGLDVARRRPRSGGP